MRSLSSALFRHGFIVFFLLLLVPLAPQPGFAQSPPPVRKLPPPPAPPPSVDQEQFLPYWTTETGWHSELQLRNNLPSSDLTVTPAFRAPDGTETVLSPVTIKPQEIATVDLETAVVGSAPQYIGTYGSLVLRYHSSDAGTLFAMLMIRNTAHSAAFHIDGRGDSQDFQVGSREGIWWLPNSSATDYLILANQGRNPLPVNLSLFDASGKSSIQRLILAPGATNRVSVRRLVTAAGLAGSFGGIKVSAADHAGSLNTVHILFDEKAEFSATLKMFDYDPKAQIKERDYAATGVWTLRAPMLALSNPDPAVAFPVGTTLQPQLFIHNVTAKPVDAALRFNWRSDSTTGKATGPTIHLSPFETRRVDVASLQDGKTLPQNAHWASVTLNTSGLPDEILAVAASYDQSLHYGAQTPFSDQLAFHWEGSMWEFDPYHDSIIAVGNGGTKPTQAALTIFYNHGTQKYELEQTLQPDEQMWIDIGKLIREHVPDKDGKTLPPDLTSGSYEVRDLTNKAIGTLFEGKVIYDKTYGHVTYGCMTCCGYTALNFDYSPLFLPVGSGAPNGVQGDDQCTGGYTWVDVSNSFYNNWSTANTTVATVDSTGYHTGMAVGITTSSTWGNLQSFNQQYHCPIQQRNMGGPDNVAKLSCSPSSVTRGSSVTCSVSGAPTGATFSNWTFKDSSNNTVSGSGTTSSWSGTMVTSGTVSVQVSASGSNSANPTASITVTARSGFALAAVSPTSEPNNSSPSPTCTLSVPSPPVPNSLLGFYCLDPEYSENDITVNDSGPNQGYHYLTSVSSTYQGTPTAYYYVISPDLSSTSSAFYLAQTGTYNAQTNPNGYISGSNLLADTIRHESGTVNSHYENYVTAQNNPTNNLGVVAEAETGPPSQSTSAFENQIKTDLTSAATSIKNAMSVEPCGSQYTYYDATCTFQGYVNYNF